MTTSTDRLFRIANQMDLLMDVKNEPVSTQDFARHIRHLAVAIKELTEELASNRFEQLLDLNPNNKQALNKTTNRHSTKQQTTLQDDPR